VASPLFIIVADFLYCFGGAGDFAPTIRRSEIAAVWAASFRRPSSLATIRYTGRARRVGPLVAGACGQRLREPIGAGILNYFLNR
jgi:hypothetical protein